MGGGRCRLAFQERSSRHKTDFLFFFSSAYVLKRSTGMAGCFNNSFLFIDWFKVQ